MKVTSEIIQNNLERLENLKKDFSILSDYEKETDTKVLNILYNEGRTYGLTPYMTFIDFIRQTKKLNQEVFYSKKISLKNFKETIVENAPDPSVKKILQSKGKVSFEKLINSPKWELYSGGRRRRSRGVRYNDNFINSTAIIANFCIQNELEIEDQFRISEWYTKNLSEIDHSIKKEIELTNEVVKFMFESLDKQSYDFKKINIENVKYFINNQIEKKMKEISEGESVRLIDSVDYYSALSPNKIYNVISKDIASGRLTVSIKNDLGFTRAYPYRIFETVSNLRNSALDELLDL